MEFTQGVRFDSLGLTEEVRRALKKKNIEESTPVQAGCIPPMREWKDVIAKAPTGTGKTFAFGIPIIEHIEPGSEETEAVILAPTRELAMQITAELRDLCVYLPGVRIVCLYGGAPIGKQIDALKKHPQIVVATPGRLSDHMKRRTVKLDNVKTVVLDEADRMLDMGFIHDVTRILDKLSSRRNLGMFSATISREVMDISWMYQRDPEEITVQAKEENKPDIAQYRIDVGQNDKAHVMAQIIRAEGHERVMAFCNTKGMTERLKAFLMMEGLDADCIHGDIPQKKREAVMARFRRGELPIFVAPDVAAPARSTPSWRPTSPPAASTSTTWTRCSTTTCRLKTSITSTASAARAAPAAPAPPSPFSSRANIVTCAPSRASRRPASKCAPCRPPRTCAPAVSK